MTGSSVTLGADTASVGLSLRAAVVHDWFQGYHGAERVADGPLVQAWLPYTVPLGFHGWFAGTG